MEKTDAERNEKERSAKLKESKEDGDAERGGKKWWQMATVDVAEMVFV